MSFKFFLPALATGAAALSIALGAPASADPNQECNVALAGQDCNNYGAQSPGSANTSGVNGGPVPNDTFGGLPGENKTVG